jgi:mono/diheme cytochrome c family protein
MKNFFGEIFDGCNYFPAPRPGRGEHSVIYRWLRPLAQSCHRLISRALSGHWKASPTFCDTHLKFVFFCCAGWTFVLPIRALADAPVNDYAAVDRIFSENCLDCHAAQDPEGKFVLENFDTLMQGGEIGKAVVPGKSTESLLFQMVEGTFEKDGKKKIMPPGKRKKLSPAEIALIKAWIDAGAHGPPAGTTVVKELVVPKILPKGTPRRPVVALAYATGPQLIAAGTCGEVELRSVTGNVIVRHLTGLHGNVNAVVFSPDGKYVFAAAGQPGVSGEVREWQVADGALIRSFEGHKDALYSAAVSPDGKILATGSYDQKIKLWDAETGKEIKTLSGHNGAIYSLAFRPDGKILASASADRTVKLWDVVTGERRDTLSQSLKELYAVAFSRDGKRLVAGGVDNRIRVWQISETAAETTNPLLDAKFAHEGAILNLVFSADGNLLLSSAEDNTVKVWGAQHLKEKLLLETQPDWARALTFTADDKTIAVGRMDGSLGFYDATTGKRMNALSAGIAPPVISTAKAN